MDPVLILSDCRTGSTALRRTLAKHPDLRVHPEELLNPDLPDTRTPDNWPIMLDRAFSEFDVIHLQRYQVRDYESRPNEGWEAIARVPSIRVISLRRRVLLNQYLSWRLAIETDHWHDRPNEVPRILFDQERANQVIEGWQNSRDQEDLYLGALPRLMVDFEDLADNSGDQLDRIQRFIGVEPASLSPAMERMPPVDYRRIFIGLPTDTEKRPPLPGTSR